MRECAPECTELTRTWCSPSGWPGDGDFPKTKQTAHTSSEQRAMHVIFSHVPNYLYSVQAGHLQQVNTPDIPMHISALPLAVHELRKLTNQTSHSKNSAKLKLEKSPLVPTLEIMQPLSKRFGKNKVHWTPVKGETTSGTHAAVTVVLAQE